MPSVFRHFHRVVYSECTLGNHVYYARYLDLLEEARGEFFRGLGRPLLGLQEQETIFPVLECRLKYKYPARYDDLLETEVRVIRLDRAFLGFAYVIKNQAGKEILEGETLHVCAGLNEKPKRLPADLKELLQNYFNPLIVSAAL